MTDTHVVLSGSERPRKQDAERIGVWSLAGHKRHEFLLQALPRFTEMELALGEQAEKELKAKLNAEQE